MARVREYLGTPMRKDSEDKYSDYPVLWLKGGYSRMKMLLDLNNLIFNFSIVSRYQEEERFRVLQEFSENCLHFGKPNPAYSSQNTEVL